MKTLFFCCGFFLGVSFSLSAQDYHAVNGSSYAGSLGIGNNPASILATPFSWDLTLVGAQFKASTNVVTIHNYSLFSNPENSKYSINRGEFERKAKAAFNLNLLNARIALDRKTAIGFGLNIRGYGNLKTDRFNYNDTIGNMREFFDLNRNNHNLNGKMTASSWLEIFGTYAKTIWDRPDSRLNAGATIRVSRGLSGAFARAANIRFQNQNQFGNQYYLLRDASLSYGYSSNFDKWADGKNTNQSTREFLASTEGGLSVDAGVEYMIKSGAVPVYDEDDYYDYEWKIGVSLLDVGLNQYRYGRDSRIASGVKSNITDTALDQKFVAVRTLAQANDTLATLANSMSLLTGKFTIMNPMRLVVNADRFLFDAFYVNAEASINLSSLAGSKYHYVTEMNLFTLTPRWETRTLGAYLPIQLTTEGRLWVGGAFKAGPLLLGVHNWANIFSKKKMQNGGGYIAIVIRPGKIVEGKRDKRLNCPR